MSRLDTPVNLEILDHLPQGVIILRHDGTVTFWNQCLEDWTGIFKSTIVGTSIDTHFPHLGTPKYTSRLEPLFTGGPPATFASQFHPQFLSCSLPSGQPRIQQTMAKTIWDEPTQAWQALIIIQDISDLNRQVVESQRLRKQAQAEMAERKESEIALRESETRLDLAVNGTHDGIWDWMDVTQNEEWWSPRFYELLGYSLGEISPSLTTFKSFLHPNDVERTTAAVQNHLEQDRPFDIDYRLRTKTGIYRWFRARGTALRDEAGRPTRMAGSIQDITEARKQEEERKSLSDRLTLATASTGMGIWDWDIINNVLKWDATMFNLYGVTPETFTGAYEAWVNGVHPDDREPAEQELQLALEGRKDFNTEFRVIRKNQSVHYIAARGIVQRDTEGNSVRMVGVNWDITQRKMAERTMADQNCLLALDAEVGQIINQTQELQPLLQQCTQAIVKHLNATFARIWTLNADQQVLELQASAGLYTHLDGPHGRVPVGQFKIGKIAAEKKPHWTNAVIGDHRASDQEWAKREGMVAFAGYPLLKGQEVVGVMALFAKHPLTALTLDSLKIVGDRITTAIERQHVHQAHQDLSLRHERILASAGEGIYGLDLEGRTTFVNPAGALMLGYEPLELIGLPMHLTMHHTKIDGSPYPREECPMYAAFKDGAVHYIEDEILWRKDGTSFPVEYTSRPIHDEQNQIVGAVVTFKDIRERQKAEKARAQLQHAIDQGIEGLALLDQDGRYTYINRAHAAMYGYTVDELMGQSWKTLYSKDQLAYIDGSCLLHLRDSGKWQGELVGLRKEGTNFPVEISLSLLTNQDGSSAGLVCTCRDITERKRAEDRFRLVVETTPNGMIMIDTSGRIVLVNKLTESLFGFSRAELIGQPIELLIPPRFRKDHPHHRSGYVAEVHPHSVMGKGRELWGLHKNGREIPIEVGLNPIETQEGRFILSSIVDITERKAAEEQIQKDAKDLEEKNKELVITRDQALAAARSKSEFLATMSHEIRTPLNGVIGMTDLLLRTELESDQHEMVETVKHSGEFLLALINDILDFSKNDAGKLDLEIIDFDIRMSVDEVLDILAERAIQKNLELIGLIYATTPLQVLGDPGRIRQILFNLIGNAIKFTQEGEIVVDVSILETTTDTSTLRFAVTDTGIGIAPETQRNLFESFTQADSSTTRQFGGTGLGLAICKQLVTLMHGEIGVISEQEHGSTFWFTIPFAHSSSSPTPLSHATLQGRRVCIVESNDTIRFLLQHYIQSWGMACDVAQNGHEGFALLQQHAKKKQPFDIALLDHTLSESIQEDGLSLAKRIRQNPEISHISLILLTAFGKRGEGKLAQNAGFNGYLTKPIRHQQLQQCLQMIVGNDQQTPSSTTSPSSTLITRHTVEEAQAHTQVHILLAEDNVVNQKVAVRMLQKIGYRVDVVENGQEAVEAIDRTPYDLVLMDCQMPEMDGLEATKKIREVEKEKREETKKILPDALPLTPHEHPRVPIIALTANALTGDRELCLEAGMDDFLTKPVRLEALSATISKWLPHRTASEAVDHPVTEKSRRHSTSLPPCLDEIILQNLKVLGGDEDPEFFISVVDQFLTDLPRHLEGIKQAIHHQDAETLVKVAHACKGSSRSIGATLLAETSYALELLGREGRMTDATSKFEQWVQEQKRTILALQQERDQLTSEVKS